MDFKTFRCSTPPSVCSHERKSRFTYFSFHGYRLTMDNTIVGLPTFPFMATDWRWCWTPKRLKVHLPTFTTGFVLPSIKIVYYQHLLVSFEGLLSLWLSDHFALVVGYINNNWLYVLSWVCTTRENNLAWLYMYSANETRPKWISLNCFKM